MYIHDTNAADRSRCPHDTDIADIYNSTYETDNVRGWGVSSVNVDGVSGRFLSREKCVPSKYLF